ncbi:dephospho-CoA kinase [Dolichospermum sp. UHCC 0684]|uniref:dephospho-CoA kinase n=1 Tax=unclassified Dolichospermum TaxID=2622029 RepID=UPI001444FA78|nr:MULTISPECIES: dephospho-CoA kinase [unclassified Dolichospermum]MEA5531203.1 dephospho-CoA kinase [Dolichospermum sp. UHCC 0684]MTJ17454.1 hypothetical protein [Dolichospermum sp. UHCC 0299]MTJ35143.1 hypothetical protein [Dolichospermum sp. UHCC 0260]MTJ39542.1 hypothetical protein [Dolichospermum sp. UHCC 0406]
MPELIVIAGANGSGKSSLTKLSASNLPVIDADAIAKRSVGIAHELSSENPESAAFAAARKAIAQQYSTSRCYEVHI